MKIEQIYTGCLAEAAYFIESNGEAAVIDPLRETEPYLELAQERGVKIKYVFETHFHADFVSGHIDLAAKTGAKLVFGPNAKPNYASYVAEDQEEFSVGEIKIKVLHTPGHTMESSSYLLIDEKGKDHAVFTGDTLFIGDVGRPDLAVKSDLTQDELAGILYDSLHQKLMKLDDDVILYPAHGAGSQCGKNMSKETVSTIGQQRKSNYALQPMTREQFIEVVTDGLSAPPAYFSENARINREGYNSIDEVMKRNMNALSVEQFEKEIKEGAWILDTRAPDDFEKEFVKGSLNIGLKGQYAVWVGSLIPFNKKLVLVTNPGEDEESILRLARVGYENVAGFLEGGVETWKKAGKEIDTVKSINAADISGLVKEGYKILDVRRNSEVEAEHVEGARNISLIDLQDQVGQLNKNEKMVVHCAGGYRSMIAASILKMNGVDNIVNVLGGFSAIQKDKGLPLVAGKCATTKFNEKLEQILG